MELRLACLCYELGDVAVLLAAGGCNSHGALYKTAAITAVRGVTAFAPEYRGTDCTFSSVVRRFHAFDIDESPQILRFLDKPFARAFHFLMVTLRPFDP